MNQLCSNMIIILLLCSLQTVSAMAQLKHSPATPAGVVTALLNLLVDEAGRQNPAKMRAERIKLEKSLKTTSTDLDGDGTPEFIVKVEMPLVCGASGNCNHYVFQRVQESFELLLQEPGQRLYALDSKSNGYHDLVIEGHISTSETFINEFAWNGSAYERSQCKLKTSIGRGSVITTAVSCEPEAEQATSEPVDLDSLASNVRNSRRSEPVPESVPVPEPAPVPVPEPTAPTPTPTPAPVLPPVPRARFLLMNGVFPVAARGYRAFPFQLTPNGISVLRGQIGVQGAVGMDINFCVTDYRGYENYVNNRVFNAYFCSGRVQTRPFELALPPGNYFIILDNRYSLLANKNVLGFVEIIQ